MRCRHDAFHLADVSKQRTRRNDVADGVNARLIGLHGAVGADEAALQLDAGLLKPHPRRVRRPAHRDEYRLRFELLTFAVRAGKFDCRALGGLRYFYDPRLGMQSNALLAKRFFKLDRNFLVLEWHGVREHLEQRDFSPEAVKNRGEFHAHGARADDHHGFGDGGKIQNFAVGQNHPRVGFQAGKHFGF